MNIPYTEETLAPEFILVTKKDAAGASYRGNAQ